MRLPDGTTLTYTVGHEVWYHAAIAAIEGADHRRHINVQASYEDDGVEWEFELVEHVFERHGPAIELCMFDDALDALAQVPELFAAMRERRPETIEQVRRILDDLGATDTTKRLSPYDERHAR